MEIYKMTIAINKKINVKINQKQRRKVSHGKTHNQNKEQIKECLNNTICLICRQVKYKNLIFGSVQNLSSKRNMTSSKSKSVHNYRSKTIFGNKFYKQKSHQQFIFYNQNQIEQNLLKGDIGHFISRNESAKILENKISKVKIVADDQYKRVTMAYLKDKDEYKQRNQMQKKFSKKLENVSIYEENTLGRLKKGYINSMIRKKEIHDRLNNIQKVKTGIIQYGELQEQKIQINQRIENIWQVFLKLKGLIRNVRAMSKEPNESQQKNKVKSCINDDIGRFSEWLKNPNNYYKDRNDLKDKLEKQNQSKKYNLNQNSLSDDQDPLSNRTCNNLCETNKFALYEQDESAEQDNKDNSIQTQSHQPLEMTFFSLSFSEITDQQLQSLTELFLSEYFQITSQIQSQVSLSNFQMKKCEQLLLILEKQDRQIDEFDLDMCQQMGKKYQVTKKSKEQFRQNLAKWKKNLQAIFFFLQYIEKRINYTRQSCFKDDDQILNKQRKSTSAQRNKSFQMSNKLMHQSCKHKLTFVADSYKQPSHPLLQVQHRNNYITQLFKFYQILSTQQFEDEDTFPLLSSINSYFYSQLSQNLHLWLNKIKQAYLHPEKTENLQLFSNITSNIAHRNYESLNCRKNKLLRYSNQSQDDQELTKQKKQDEFTDRSGKSRNSMTKQDESEFISRKREIDYRNSKMNSAYNIANSEMCSSLVNLVKLRSSFDHDPKQAIRIRLLKDLDKDYYKMLKSTLKMQKENTRKNYQFLRTFKRAKYSSRDQILEEKRFECSFSNVFMVGKQERDSKQKNNRIKMVPEYIKQNKKQSNSGNKKRFDCKRSNFYQSIYQKKSNNQDKIQIKKSRIKVIKDSGQTIQLSRIRQKKSISVRRESETVHQRFRQVRDTKDSKQFKEVKIASSQSQYRVRESHYKKNHQLSELKKQTSSNSMMILKQNIKKMKHKNMFKDKGHDRIESRYKQKKNENSDYKQYNQLVQQQVDQNKQSRQLNDQNK